MTNQAKSKSARMTFFMISLVLVPVLVILFYFYDNAPAPRFSEFMETQDSLSSLETMEMMWKHHPGHAPIALELGNLYFEAGRYEDAITFYREYMKLDTSAAGWEVRLDVCRALHELGRIEAAKRELDTMLLRDPHHAGVLYNYGAIEANAGEYDEARQHWSLLIEKHPQDSLAQFAARSMKILDQRETHP